MPLLVVDAGHSRLKVHLYQSEKITRWLCPLKPFTWPNNLTPSNVTEVLLMGTNERHLVRLRSHLSQLNFPVPAQLGIDLMVPTSSATPLQGVGNDRLANVLGASFMIKNQQSCLILSAGSAITLDRLNAEGQHEGGLIGMGWTHYREAMLALDAKLVSSSDPALEFPGKKTEDAVALGWKESVLAMILKIRQPNEKLYITGGDAERLLPSLASAVHVPYLGVDGMARQLNYHVSELETTVDLTLPKNS